jgi:hypothetical protein
MAEPKYYGVTSADEAAVTAEMAKGFDFGTAKKNVYSTNEYNTRLEGIKAGNAITPTVLSSANGQKTVEKITGDIGKEATGIANHSTGRVNTEATTKSNLSDVPPEVQAEIDSLKTEEQKAEDSRNKVVDDRSKAYDSLAIANTAATQASINTLRTTYNITRQEMQEANAKTAKGAQTVALRTGQARYAPDSTAKVIEGIQMSGLKNLQNLDAKYVSAVAEAESALSQKNYTLAKEKYDEMYKAKNDTLTEIRKQQDEVRKIADEWRKNQKEEEKSISDIAKDAAKNGASGETIDSIMNSGSLAGAIKTAGSYLQTGSGIVAEYMFYKRDSEARGVVPMDFDDYQTRDANRKVSLASAATGAGTNLNSKEQAVFNKIVDKYNASEAIKARDRASNLKEIVAAVEKDPENAASQLNLIYAYIKGLDTDSAVREGEIDLVKSIDSYTGKFQNEFDRIGKGRSIRPEVAKQIAQGAKDLIATITKTAERKEAVYRAQAKQNGNNVYDAVDGFFASVGETYGDLVNEGLEAKQTVDTYIQSNPADAENIAKMYEVEGTTDEDVLDYLRSKGKIK